VGLYHKSHLRHNEWKLGFDFVVDLTNRALLKKDLVVGYEKPEFSVYLKGEQKWDRPTGDFNQWRQFFSRISLTGLYRRNARQLYGVEVAADPLGNAIT